MKVIIMLGTRFVPSAKDERYEESRRFEFYVPETTTIRALIAMVDRESAPKHPGSSYLSLPSPHQALPESATVAHLNLADEAVLRRFSKVR